jgi:hypothetical protein
MPWEYTNLTPTMEECAGAPYLGAVLQRVTVHLMAVLFHHTQIRWFPSRPSEINSSGSTAGGLRPRYFCVYVDILFLPYESIKRKVAITIPRSLCLYKGYLEPSYTPRHRVPFSSISTTRRATVDVLKPSSAWGNKQSILTYHPAKFHSHKIAKATRKDRSSAPIEVWQWAQQGSHVSLIQCTHTHTQITGNTYFACKLTKLP